MTGGVYTNGLCSAENVSCQRAPSISPVASVSPSSPGPSSSGHPSRCARSTSSGNVAFRARGVPVKSASQSAASPSSSGSVGTRSE